MSNGYGVSKNNIPDSGAVTVAAESTNTVVSGIQRISAGDSKNLVVRVKTSSTTVTNSIIAKLQQRWSDNEDWQLVGDQGQVAITADGWTGFRMNIENSSDEAQLPLAPQVRLVVTTGVDDTCKVDYVYFSERR